MGEKQVLKNITEGSGVKDSSGPKAPLPPVSKCALYSKGPEWVERGPGHCCHFRV